MPPLPPARSAPGPQCEDADLPHILLDEEDQQQHNQHAARTGTSAAGAASTSTATTSAASTSASGGPGTSGGAGPSGHAGAGPRYRPALLCATHMLVGALGDGRIAIPDVKEQLMATLAAMLDHGCACTRVCVAARDCARLRLMAALWPTGAHQHAHPRITAVCAHTGARACPCSCTRRLMLGAIEQAELAPHNTRGPRLVPMVVTLFDSKVRAPARPQQRTHALPACTLKRLARSAAEPHCRVSHA